jgi:uncharacterized membrane protein YkgB
MISESNYKRLFTLSIGIIFLWFGVLKFFPGISPAQDLALETIDQLTFSLIPTKLAIILLALWEVTVGVLFLLNIIRKEVIYLALAHMLLTFSPMFFFPHLVFNDNPLTLTLVGQYIIKNLVIISVLLSLLPKKNRGRLQVQRGL